MKHGSIKIIIQSLVIFFYSLPISAENKISSSPLINLNELKPSFEEVNDQSNEINNNQIITKRKNKEILQDNNSSAKLIGLDKITAKT